MKTISSPVYTIRLFEDSKSEDFINALDIYINQIPSELRTSSNEIIYWIDNYNKSFEDKLLIFGFYENDKIIGFSQCLYFKKESFITIDYFVIASSHRGNHSFQMIIAILKEFLKEYKLEFNFIVTEVESKNKSLLQLLKMNGFGEIQSKYFQPSLGINNHDSLIEAKILYFPAYEDRVIKKETYKMIVETIYNNHYIRWYKEFLSEKDLKSYMVIIEQLKVKIFDNLNAEININGGIKPMNDYSEFNVGREIKNTTTILGIIFIFALITLLLGKAFDMSLLQTISFVIINTSMFFLVYSLVSKNILQESRLQIPPS